MRAEKLISLFLSFIIFLNATYLWIPSSYTRCSTSHINNVQMLHDVYSTFFCGSGKQTARQTKLRTTKQTAVLNILLWCQLSQNQNVCFKRLMLSLYIYSYSIRLNQTTQSRNYMVNLISQLNMPLGICFSHSVCLSHFRVPLLRRTYLPIFFCRAHIFKFSFVAFMLFSVAFLIVCLSFFSHSFIYSFIHPFIHLFIHPFYFSIRSFYQIAVSCAKYKK